MAIQVLDKLTPREYEMFNQRKEMFELEAQQALAVKRMEIEVAKLEAKWSSLLRLPIFLLKLPVLVILAIGFCIAVARGKELSSSFWAYMK